MIQSGPIGIYVELNTAQVPKSDSNSSSYYTHSSKFIMDFYILNCSAPASMWRCTACSEIIKVVHLYVSWLLTSFMISSIFRKQLRQGLSTGGYTLGGIHGWVGIECHHPPPCAAILAPPAPPGRGQWSPSVGRTSITQPAGNGGRS